jgi:hypothetical protein
MVEVTVRVCDVCKERIAIGTCPTCNRDICKPDTQAFSIEIGLKWKGPAIELYRENVCAECSKEIEAKSKEIMLHLIAKVQPEVKEVLRQYAKR